MERARKQRCESWASPGPSPNRCGFGFIPCLCLPGGAGFLSPTRGSSTATAASVSTRGRSVTHPPAPGRRGVPSEGAGAAWASQRGVAGADAPGVRVPSLQQGKSSSTGNLLDKDDIALPPPDYGMGSQAFPAQGSNAFKQRPYSVAVPAFSQVSPRPAGASPAPGGCFINGRCLSKALGDGRCWSLARGDPAVCGSSALPVVLSQDEMWF